MVAMPVFSHGDTIKNVATNYNVQDVQTVIMLGKQGDAPAV
jgi:hypothetical protein